MRWVDPATGKPREEKCEAATGGRAQREAGDLEKKLREDGTVDDTAWATFCRRYEKEKLAGLAVKTQRLWATARKSLEKFRKPAYLEDVTTDFLSRYAAKLRSDDLSAASIGAYLRQLRAGLRWGSKVFPAYRPPVIEIPKVLSPMKGRPLAAEEFERMLAKTSKVVGQENAGSWRRLLRGLWLSGFRLGEALRLWWDRPGSLSLCQIDSREAKVLIPAAEEKGRKNRQLPIAPDFAIWLSKVPAERRRGLVFRPRLGVRTVRTIEEVSKTISAIGEKAKIKVKESGEHVKFASAHDLRRSFAQRWARKLRPIDLMRLMRHADIQTTMKYYVGEDADRLGKELWIGFGDQTGDQDELLEDVESSREPT